MALTMVSVPTLELVDELQGLYSVDTDIQKLLQQLSQGALTPHYTMRNGILYHKSRLCIPNSKPFKLKLLEALHNSPTGGHSGFDTILHRVWREFFWHGLKADVKEFIRQCDVIERVGEVAYRVDLPASSQIHHVFHISLLKKRIEKEKLMYKEMEKVNFTIEHFFDDTVEENVEILIERPPGKKVKKENLRKWKSWESCDAKFNMALAGMTENRRLCMVERRAWVMKANRDGGAQLELEKNKFEAEMMSKDLASMNAMQQDYLIFRGKFMRHL
ncbi:hypothetical protein F2P56_019497 [Juglans regia]|uniref:Integrase zinc-binding domain-containing protein n=1 Tax=Juglans regia TaxID=51240 RepID=A0A833UKQ7_JUGRE|nr:hypothetical protein F2P56_019497 [Juglans regia]